MWTFFESNEFCINFCKNSSCSLKFVFLSKGAYSNSWGVLKKLNFFLNFKMNYIEDKLSFHLFHLFKFFKNNFNQNLSTLFFGKLFIFGVNSLRLLFKSFNFMDFRYFFFKNMNGAISCWFGNLYSPINHFYINP